MPKCLRHGKSPILSGVGHLLASVWKCERNLVKTRMSWKVSMDLPSKTCCQFAPMALTQADVVGRRSELVSTLQKTLVYHFVIAEVEDSCWCAAFALERKLLMRGLATAITFGCRAASITSLLTQTKCCHCIFCVLRRTKCSVQSFFTFSPNVDGLHSNKQSRKRSQRIGHAA